MNIHKNVRLTPLVGVSEKTVHRSVAGAGADASVVDRSSRPHTPRPRSCFG